MTTTDRLATTKWSYNNAKVKTKLSPDNRCNSFAPKQPRQEWSALIAKQIGTSPMKIRFNSEAVIDAFSRQTD